VIADPAMAAPTVGQSIKLLHAPRAKSDGNPEAIDVVSRRAINENVESPSAHRTAPLHQSRTFVDGLAAALLLSDDHANNIRV